MMGLYCKLSDCNFFFHLSCHPEIIDTLYYVSVLSRTNSVHLFQLEQNLLIFMTRTQTYTFL